MNIAETLACFVVFLYRNFTHTAQGHWGNPKSIRHGSHECVEHRDKIKKAKSQQNRMHISWDSLHDLEGKQNGNSVVNTTRDSALQSAVEIPVALLLLIVVYLWSNYSLILAVTPSLLKLNANLYIYIYNIILTVFNIIIITTLFLSCQTHYLWPHLNVEV